MQMIDAVQKDNIVLIGIGGSGKTTLLKQLEVDLAKGSSGPIPLYVDLVGRSNSRSDLLSSVLSTAEVHSFSDRDTEFYFEQMAKRSELIILLDGLDEVPSDFRLSVLRDVKKWAEQYPRIRFVIAARERIGLDHFHEYYVCRLSPDQVQNALNAHIHSNAPDSMADLLRIPLFLFLYLNLKDAPLPNVQIIPNQSQFLKYYFDAISNKVDDEIKPQWKYVLEWLLPTMAYELGPIFSIDQFSEAIDTANNHIKGRTFRKQMDEETVAEILMQAGVIRKESDYAYRFRHEIIREYLSARAIEMDLNTSEKKAFGDVIPHNIGKSIINLASYHWVFDLLFETKEARRNCAKNISFFIGAAEQTGDIEILAQREDITLIGFVLTYWRTFSLPPDLFMQRLTKLKCRFEDWEKLIDRQFWLGAHTLPPVLRAMGWVEDSLFESVLEQMDHPEQVEWEFIGLLGAELNISAQDLEIHFGLLDSLQYELEKESIAQATRALIQYGINRENVLLFFKCCPSIFAICSSGIISRLIEYFGEDFSQYINNLHGSNLEEELIDFSEWLF